MQNEKRPLRVKTMHGYEHNLRMHNLRISRIQHTISLTVLMRSPHGSPYRMTMAYVVPRLSCKYDSTRSKPHLKNECDPRC